MKKELEGYGISTGTFLEKSEFVSALEKARKDYYGDENGMDDDGRRRRNKSCTNNNKSKKPREERIVEELENCKGMKVSELKKELEGLNLDISTFFEKSELVKVLADARVDGTATATTSSKASHDDDKNILSVDDVKDIYDIRSRYDAKYKCNNRFCTEVETKTNKVKFRECSQCQQAIYCSAECQKREVRFLKLYACLCVCVCVCVCIKYITNIFSSIYNITLYFFYVFLFCFFFI
jgi:hypothetical protein